MPLKATPDVASRKEKAAAANRARSLKWYRLNRERSHQVSKEWRRNNPAKVRAHWNAWEAKNAEKYKALRHAASVKDRPAGTVRMRAWRKRNPARNLANQRKWTKLHPEVFRIKSKARRALVRGAAVNLRSIKQFMAEVKAKPFAICYYCGGQVSGPAIHFDHIVALANGGAHSVENLCVACADCNRRKGSKTLRAWVRIGQQLLEL